jgi:nucleoside-diphosphate-sugar epimerase
VRPILVTGAQGFVGRAFVAAALSAGERVVGLGRSPRSDTCFTHTISIRGRSIPAPLPAALRSALATDAYQYVQSDLLDTESVRSIVRSTRPSAVVHLASALRDDPPRRLTEANIAATVSLVDVLQEDADIKCAVIGSSAAVYGQPRTLPISETSELAPIDAYGVTKAAAEQLAAIGLRDCNTRIAFARIFNVVGAGQDERHVCGRFVAQAVAARASGAAVLQVGDLSPTRDFIDVRDVASALLVLVQSSLASDAYNVCSGRETAIRDVLAIALHSADMPDDLTIEPSYRRAADASRSVGDNSKLRALGWAPRFSLEESIADVTSYYRSIAVATGAESSSARPISSASSG